MLEIGRVARAAAAAVCAAALAAGCSGSDDAPEPPDGGAVTVTTMRGALLRAEEIGPTWKPLESADPARLVAFCGGAATAPPVPPGAEVVAQPLVDEGDKGAQTLHQTALVYPDATGAQAGLAALRALADGCPASVSQPATVTAEKSEPAYTESTRTTALTEGGWTGFVITRHKAYEPKHPGTADTAISVLSRQNVLVVDAYALYRIGTASGPSQFDADWKKLLGTVLNRVG